MRSPLSTNRVTRTTSKVNITGSVDMAISQSNTHTSTNNQLTQLRNDTFIVPVVLFNTPQPPQSENTGIQYTKLINSRPDLPPVVMSVVDLHSLLGKKMEEVKGCKSSFEKGISIFN